jgi:hypothetical protein
MAARQGDGDELADLDELRALLGKWVARVHASRHLSPETPVPIPERLQWLPLDPEGRAVPYRTLWSSELETYLAWDDLIGRKAVFTSGAMGEGLPLVGLASHPARERRCAALHLCRNCATPLRSHSCCWFFVRPNIEAIRYAREHFDLGPDGVIGQEPVVCRVCANYSVQVCPPLIRERGLQYRHGRSTIVAYRVQHKDIRVHYQKAPPKLDPSGEAVDYPLIMAVRAEPFTLSELLTATASPTPEPVPPKRRSRLPWR